MTGSNKNVAVLVGAVMLAMSLVAVAAPKWKGVADTTEVKYEVDLGSYQLVGDAWVYSARLTYKQPHVQKVYEQGDFRDARVKRETHRIAVFCAPDEGVTGSQMLNSRYKQIETTRYAPDGKKLPEYQNNPKEKLAEVAAIHDALSRDA